MTACIGCRAALCCRSDFPLFAGEAERIRPHVPARAMARIRRDRTLLEPLTTGHPCPMLDPDGSCSIYDHRPLVCRAFDSEVPAPACMLRTPESVGRVFESTVQLRQKHGKPAGGWYDTITGWTA